MKHFRVLFVELQADFLTERFPYSCWAQWLWRLSSQEHNVLISPIQSGPGPSRQLRVHLLRVFVSGCRLPGEQTLNVEDALSFSISCSRTGLPCKKQRFGAFPEKLKEQIGLKEISEVDTARVWNLCSHKQKPTQECFRPQYLHWTFLKKRARKCTFLCFAFESHWQTAHLKNTLM